MPRERKVGPAEDLVKELFAGMSDAQKKDVVLLGGAMAAVTDEAGIQFRILNSRKGPAVRATRAVAVVFSQPTTHRTIQLKGTDAQVGPLAA